MPSGALAALGALLFVLILAALAAAALMEARSRRAAAAHPVYVINDAVSFALNALDPAAAERVGPAGVRRIIEWSAHYLQGLAVPARQRRGLVVVAGGEGNAVEYIRRELSRSGREYSPADIAAVLAGEAGYLADIGALGERADEQELV